MWQRSEGTVTTRESRTKWKEARAEPCTLRTLARAQIRLGLGGSYFHKSFMSRAPTQHREGAQQHAVAAGTGGQQHVATVRCAFPGVPPKKQSARRVLGVWVALGLWARPDAPSHQSHASYA